MGAKWPESASFADVKDVHARRRTRPTEVEPDLTRRTSAVLVSPELKPRRTLRSMPPVAASGVSVTAAARRLPAMHGLAAVSALATLAVVLACSFGSSRTSFGRGIERVSHRSGDLSIVDARGTSKYLRTNGNATTVVPGDKFAGDCTIRQDMGAFTAVDMHGDGRIALTGAATVDFGRVQVADADRARLKLAARAGELSVTLTSGQPMVEIKLPQGDTIYASIGECTISASDTGSTVTVRAGKVKILSAGRRKSAYIAAGQQMTISKDNRWESAPVRLNSQA